MRQIRHSIHIMVSIALSALLATPLLVQADQVRVVHLKGKAVGETREIPVVEATGTEEGNCFDVEMIEPKDHSQIGTATRCFTDVKTVKDGLKVTETTFLKFRDGTIVARNHATIQPILDDAADMSHIIVPTPLMSNLLVERSTEQYRGMPGNLRFGGVVNLRDFQEKNEIVFDDIAVVTLTDIQQQVKLAQRRLAELGFYNGAIDGLLGPKTEAALHAYQAKHGLPKTGQLDEATRKALNMQQGSTAARQ